MIRWKLMGWQPGGRRIGAELVRPGFVYLLVLLVGALGLTACQTHTSRDVVAKPPRPFTIDRFQPAIDAFRAADQTNPPPLHAILFVGSSIFRQWTNVAEQLAPPPVFNRAFGGARTIELLHYLDDIVMPYAPRVIVYYCGSNDVNAGESAASIAAQFREFSQRVWRRLPETRIIFAAINLAPQKQDRWDIVRAANRLAQDFCETDERLDYVDLNRALFDAAGQPRLELYRADRLHFVPAAYVEFAALLQPPIAAAWRQTEP